MTKWHAYAHSHIHTHSYTHAHSHIHTHSHSHKHSHTHAHPLPQDFAGIYGGLCGLRSLTRLSLSHNKLSLSSSSLFAKLILQCRLGGIPLDHLDLSHNPIEDEGITTIFQFVCAEFAKDGNSASSSPSHTIPILESSSSNSQVSLSLTLRSLSLSNVGMMERGCLSLSLSLQSCFHLDHLDISGNTLSDSSALDILRSSIKSHSPSPSPSLSPPLSSSLTSLSLSHSLSSLNLRFCRLTDSFIPSLLPLLSPSPSPSPSLSLRSLSLGGNSFSSSSLSSLFSSLHAKAYPLIHLDIQGTRIDHAAMDGMREWIVGTTSLRSLVTSCDISVTQSLMRALEVCTQRECE